MVRDASAFWDEMYSGEAYRYGTEPNRFLVEHVDRIPTGGRVLCLGDGEGRNGVWLAQQGFEVVSMDASEVGLRKAQALAAERGVRIETIRGTVPLHPLPEASFDGVVLLFLHLTPEFRSAVHAQSASALRSGGLLVLEAFTPEQLKFESGGPRRPEMLYTPALLRSDFEDLDVELLEQVERRLQEGAGHVGLADVVRLIARRSGPEDAACS